MNRVVQLRVPAIQLTLDQAAAENAKRAALTRVDEHASPAWKDYALDVVKHVAETRYEFTTDEVLAEMQAAPVWTHELRALGPVMSAAQRAGYIRATDRFIASASVSRHKAPKRVWRSRLCSQPAQPQQN